MVFIADLRALSRLGIKGIAIVQVTAAALTLASRLVHLEMQSTAGLSEVCHPLSAVLPSLAHTTAKG